ncbi:MULTISPECIES: hypothetical protein [Calditerrivibrio]|uniref:Uncharacterized protein n=1 Tax=Calditerrivibrio nitroreducens TaxID=477976 RepID=A0A2J6WM35_9BACT|nr:MAG: hypothetical protein C0187_04135 [Calditerrivibrio nitroreducens]
MLIGRISLLTLVLVIILEAGSYCYVYVYEVTTSDRRFQTASKLSPNTFFLSNGGKDLIKELKIVKVYADNDFKKALKEFKLENENANILLPKKAPDDRSTNPYIWWR